MVTAVLTKWDLYGGLEQRSQRKKFDGTLRSVLRV